MLIEASHTCVGCWYAIQTRSRSEAMVTTLLGRQGVRTYLPVITEVHNWADRRKVVAVPVFAGYTFARFTDDPVTRLRILQTRAAARIVGNAAGPVAIPSSEIDQLRQMLERSGSCSAHPYIREGEPVRILRGPLRGLEGVLVRFKGASRLVISIHLLSQSVATEIDTSDVESVRRVRQ